MKLSSSSLISKKTFKRVAFVVQSTHKKVYFIKIILFVMNVFVNIEDKLIFVLLYIRVKKYARKCFFFQTILQIASQNFLFMGR